jgi:hypothetical protein
MKIFVKMVKKLIHGFLEDFEKKGYNDKEV